MLPCDQKTIYQAAATIENEATNINILEYLTTT